MMPSQENDLTKVVFDFGREGLVPAKVTIGSKSISDNHPPATFTRAAEPAQCTVTDTPRS